MVNGIPGFLGFLVIFSLAGDMVNKNTLYILLHHIIIMIVSITMNLSTIIILFTMNLSTMNLSTMNPSIIILSTITSERRGMVMVWGMEVDIMGDTMVDMDMVIMDIIPTVTITKNIVITMDMVMFTVMDMNLTINKTDVTTVLILRFIKSREKIKTVKSN